VTTTVPASGSGARAGVEPALTAYRPPKGRLRQSGTTSAHPCIIDAKVTPRTSPSNVTLPGQAGAASVIEDLAAMAERSIATETTGDETF
jgi:hypothetical protein